MKAAVMSLVIVMVAAATLAQSASLKNAETLFEGGRLPEAEKAAAAVVRAEPKNADARLLYGRVLIDSGRSDKAIEHLEKAVELAPKNAVAHYHLGNAYGDQALRANVMKQAILAKKVHRAFEEAVRLDPRHIEAREGLMQFYLVAPAVMGGSREKAAGQAKEIGKIDRAKGFIATSRLQIASEDYSAAEATLEAAVREFPRHRDLRLSLGFLQQRNEAWAKAFTTFEAIVQLDPADGRALYQVGRTAALSGQQLEKGEEALLRYVRTTPKRDEPTVAYGWYRLGNIYEKQSRIGHAKDAYGRALKLDPKLKEASEALKKLP